MCTGSGGVGVRCGAVREGQYLRDARPLLRSEFLDVCDDLRGTNETPTYAHSMRHVTSTHVHKMQRATSIQRSEVIRVHTTLSPAPLSASARLSCAHFRDEKKKYLIVFLSRPLALDEAPLEVRATPLRVLLVLVLILVHALLLLLRSCASDITTSAHP